jgi:phage baseplate assembly protein W
MAEPTKKFLGRGLRFPLNLGADGDFQKDIETERILQSCLNIILLTRLRRAANGNYIGERVWKPEFGSELTALKHEPNTPETYQIVRRAIMEPIQKWEPRIKDLVVNIIPSETDKYTVLVFISYKIKATNDDGNLVFPFFLE